jgi:hypothetical protein
MPRPCSVKIVPPDNGPTFGFTSRREKMGNPVSFRSSEGAPQSASDSRPPLAPSTKHAHCGSLVYAFWAQSPCPLHDLKTDPPTRKFPGHCCSLHVGPVHTYVGVRAQMHVSGQLLLPGGHLPGPPAQAPCPLHIAVHEDRAEQFFPLNPASHMQPELEQRPCPEQTWTSTCWSRSA